MYVLHDCQSSTGSWKSYKLKDLKAFAEWTLGMESTSWIHFRKQDSCVSPCERYEAEKVDGRTVRDIEWI